MFSIKIGLVLLVLFVLLTHSLTPSLTPKVTCVGVLVNVSGLCSGLLALVVLVVFPIVVLFWLHVSGALDLGSFGSVLVDLAALLSGSATIY